MTDGAFSVWPMVILASICILCILVKIKIIVEEVSVHQNCCDHRRTIGTEKCKKIKARHLDGVLANLYKGFPTGKTTIVVYGKTPWVFSILFLDELFDFETDH